MKDFRGLQVWNKAHELIQQIYAETQAFPKEERYGLTSQVRRAGVSIAANIDEGCGRGSDKDFGRFLQIAMGSASETEYLLLLARDLGFLAEDSHDAFDCQTAEVKRMLASLILRLKADR